MPILHPINQQPGDAGKGEKPIEAVTPGVSELVAAQPDKHRNQAGENHQLHIIAPGPAAPVFTAATAGKSMTY
jgi:hypothetical protein